MTSTTPNWVWIRCVHGKEGVGGSRDRDTKEEKQTATDWSRGNRLKQTKAESKTHRHKRSHADSETKREREKRNWGYIQHRSLKWRNGVNLFLGGRREKPGGERKKKKTDSSSTSHIKVDVERPGFAGFLAVGIVHEVSVSALILQGRQRVDEDGLQMAERPADDMAARKRGNENGHMVRTCADQQQKQNKKKTTCQLRLLRK